MFLLLTLFSYVFAADAACLAIPAMEDVLKKVDGVLDEGAAVMSGLANSQDAILAEAGKFLGAFLTEAKKRVDTEADKIETAADDFCIKCEDIDGYFNKFQGDIKLLAGVIGKMYPKVQGEIDWVINKIGMVLNVVCPTPPPSASTTAAALSADGKNCLANDVVQQFLGAVEAGITDAMTEMKTLESSSDKLIAAGAKIASAALSKAELLVAEATWITENVCNDCEDVARVYNGIKGPLEMAVAVLDPKIKNVVDVAIAKT